jgi:hypothetical protein
MVGLPISLTMVSFLRALSRLLSSSPPALPKLRLLRNLWLADLIEEEVVVVAVVVFRMSMVAGAVFAVLYLEGFGGVVEVVWVVDLVPVKG